MFKKALSDPDSTLSVVYRLFRENARAYIGSYVLAFLFMGLVSASTAASAWIMKDVINEIFINRQSQMVWIISGAVVAIYLIKGLATYGQTVVLSRIGNNIVARIQKRIYDHVLTQGIDFYDRHAMGDLTTRLSHNAQAARDVINMIVTSFGRDLLSLIGLGAVMVIQDPFMSLFALVTMPPAVWGVARLVKRVKKIARQEFMSLAKVVSALNETVLGARIVQAFNLQGHMRGTMHTAVEKVEARANKIAKINARTSPIMETLGGLAIAGVIFYGGYSVIELGRDPGAFFSFIAALLMAYEPGKRLARLNVQIQTGLVGVRILFSLLDTPTNIIEKPDARPLEVTAGRIRFEGVSFAYGKAAALNGMTVEMKPGAVTALVGPSGAGKSTMLALIERFYDPQEGAVTIDGTDIRDVTLESLRDHMALVTQDTFLFDGTIRENIAHGRPGASDGEIVEAARNANAHGFIEAAPEGYETEVGEGGGRLSGGQKQRIAIARAMLRDAPILLLDEATSALDSESEAKVQEALDRLMAGRTTVVIAHRLSTVRRADVIHVIDRGKLIESGSHHELIERGGKYRYYYELQFKEEDTAVASGVG